MSNTSFNEYVYFGGKRIARRNSSAVYYYIEDHLGTSREIVHASQTSACYDADFYPYGGEMTVTDTCDSAYKFTGKERDSLAENGNLDNFGARYDASSMGRFMSPDPLHPSRSHPRLLNQFLADPQNWNKYSYVLNNPLKHTDESGHFTGDDHERMQMNAMLANGYSQGAAQVSATADRHMDHWYNAAPGLPGAHYLTTHDYQNRVNPQHGERGENQTPDQAEAVANSFMSSKTRDAATRALQGDVRGALADIGQASHTAQDIVRHNFEPGSQHPYGEAPATEAEIQAAAQATQKVLNEFTDQLFQQGSQAGLNIDQIMDVYKRLQQGPEQDSSDDKHNKHGWGSDCH